MYNTINNVQYNEQCTMYSTVNNEQCTLYNVQCTLQYIVVSQQEMI